MFDIAVIFIVLLSLIVAFLRGFIKEIFGLVGICLSIILTIHFYDYFAERYNEYISSEVVSAILSSITVFIIVTVTIIVVNSWIMYLLSAIRLGIVDRFAGLLMGVVKGIIFSYFLFFIIKVSCYTLSPESASIEEKDTDMMLPSWFAKSYSYQAFSLLDSYINEVIPLSTHDKIKNIGDNIQNMLNKKDKAKQNKDAKTSVK